MKEVESFIQNNLDLKENDYVIAGISGGPDSMVLLNLLISFKNKYNFNIVCAHVNHNMRSESEAEKDMVKDYCLKHDVSFEYMKIENYGDDNFHNEARTIRYNFFENLVDKYNAKVLFTAHHGDDLMETILMRITRGSSLKGYAGFSRISKRKNYLLVRPLITMTKDEILKVALENNIPYAVDASNAKDVYTRNRFRKNILPALKNESSLVHSKFYKFSNTLLEYEEYMSNLIDEKISLMYKNSILDLNLFNLEKDLIKKCILQRILEDYYQDDLFLINDVHVNLILSLIEKNQASGFICLPNEIRVYKEYDKLYIKHYVSIDSTYEIEFSDVVILPNGKKIETVKSSSSDSNYICRLSKENVTFPLIVRTRNDGDKMFVKGLNGEKKVNDIFIDAKIPKTERELYPVVTDSENKIVWLPGLKKSKFDKTKYENYDIILKYEKEGSIYE